MIKSKKDRLAELIAELRAFRFCGPSDDPDEQTAVTAGYRHLLVQFKRLARPLLPEADVVRLNALDVEVNNIYSVYDAHAEIDALLPDVEALLERTEEGSFSVATNAWIIESGLIDRLATAQSVKLDVRLLVQICREINSCFAHGNVVATALLMRTVLNYVPPIFGHDTFPQVLANINRSLKESFDHLENGLRKIADYHTHRRIGPADCYPSSAQIEPFKPQFELLLQEVVTRANAG